MSQFSKSVIKRVKAMTKNQLVEKLVELNNYAEIQKAQNMILLARVKELENLQTEAGVAAETKNESAAGAVLEEGEANG